ncbi:hypothetical protein HDE_10815 [Halotydeus destructor]|nr:hypothetical protein HDE_10815 [Halotydeus destructor]
MIKLAVYLLLVTWCVPMTEATLLAGVFHLVGTLVRLLGQLTGPRDDSSSGRAEGEPMTTAEKDFRNCIKTTSPDYNDTRIIGCGYCNGFTKNTTIAAANDRLCARTCHRNRCSIYKDDDGAGCISGVRDYCQCAYPRNNVPVLFVILGEAKRKIARDTPAGNCTS